MEPITITLDGSEVSGDPGMSILELATEIGIEIPTLCHHAPLSPLGACRVCIVEEERSGRLLASCVTPIAPGMVINTKSDRVLENRRIVVELMLASHPDACIVCDKGNRCKLRKIAADLGIGLVPFEKIPSYRPIVDLNPFIRRDLSKCIRCGRCIRADQEVAVVGAIDFTDRGFEARPATLLDEALERTDCNFCGICISVCPTGALAERHRPSELTASHATRTVCTLCGGGCEIFLDHRWNRILGTRPTENGRSVNQVSLCVKGHYGMDFLDAEGRLTTPLVRNNNGELVPASWDEALDLVAGRFLDMAHNGGGVRLGALGASRCTNEENYLLQKFMRTVVGSNHIDSGARLRCGALSAGIERILGYGTMTGPISEVREAEEILVIGADPLAVAPILGQAIKQAVKFSGAHLTLVDPLPRGLSRFTGTWIRPRPGTHSIFLAGLVREMLCLGCAGSPAATRIHAQDLARLERLVGAFSKEYVEDRTGIPARLVKATAERFSRQRRLAVIPGAGVSLDQGAFSSGVLLALLVVLSGGLGRQGSGLFPVAGSLNDQGALDMGACPNRLPGHQELWDPEARARFGQAWGSEPPAEPGMDYLSMIEAAEEGKIAGLYVVGENPVRDCPGGDRTREALSRLELLVVQDLFLTETAEIAHVVLPGASFAEKDGTVTSLERRVQRVRKAVQPPGEARPDGAILFDLAARMGSRGTGRSWGPVLEEINWLVPLYRGITPERVDQESGGLFWPCMNEQDPGSPMLGLREGARVGVPEELALPEGVPTSDLYEYPLWLLTGQTLFHSADGVRTERSMLLTKAAGEGCTLMNPYDSGPLGIRGGAAAVIRSPCGSVRTKVVLSEEVPRGILFAPSLGSCLPNQLFAVGARDPVHGSPFMHWQAVRVEAANGDE